jgi:C-terminal processing protease CtpA/Prc
MNARVTKMLVPLLGLTALACAESSEPVPSVEVRSNALRPVTTAEALTDYDEMVTEFRTLYGALERKQDLYDFSFDELASDTRAKLAAATSEGEFLGIFNQFIARFEDAHLAILNGAPADDSYAYTLPLRVMPIEDTYVVYWVDPTFEDAPFARGDELLTIDGEPAAKAAQRFSSYDGAPNAKFLAHLAANYLTRRPVYLSGDLRDGQSVALTLRDAHGKKHDVTLTWHQTPHVLPPVPVAAAGEHHRIAFSRAAQLVATDELTELGAPVPFFMTRQVVDTYGIHGGIVPSALAVQMFDVNPGLVQTPPYNAYIYTYCDTRILLLRLSDYAPTYDNATDEQAITANLAWLRALLYDQASQVDGLVLDQTHNPGGDLEFAHDVLALLAKQAVPGVVQKMHGDRMWIQAYLDAAQQVRSRSSEDNPEEAVELEGYAHQIDLAYSNGVALTDPLPFPEIPDTIEPDPVAWTKPVLVLADEMSASCADTVPLVVKADGLGTLFGARTMGAGGTVETVAYLPNTNYGLYLSRGLLTVRDPSGAYPEDRFIEDHGVAPDIAYEHTLADFRAGYVGYVRAFSDAMVAAAHAE